MKKFSLAKILSLVFVCVMLLGALALTTFAAEDEKVEIVAANVYYGDVYQIMYAVNAPEGATLKATDSKGNEINVVPFAEEPTANVNGVDCKIYILETGVAAQAIDEVITLTVEYGNKKSVKNYSILQYIYERSQVVDGAELEMLQALLDYAIKADVFLDKTPVENSFGAYTYVKVKGVTVNGINPTGMYLVGSTPFASIDAIEYDAEKYELVFTVNGETKTLDEVKALTVGDTAITVVAEIVEKVCEHNYEAVVTAPTCSAAGYTTYTCDSCGDTYTANEVPAVDHKDDDGDYSCDFDACSEILAPEADSVLTIEQAIKLGKLFKHNTYTTGKYYVTGTIQSVYQTVYGNMYLTDGTNKFTVYGTFLNGVQYGSFTGTKPVAGDVITVYGVIGAYSSTPQMKNGDIQHSNEIVVTAPTCTEGGYTTTTCKFCGATSTSDETNALEHNFVNGVCDREGCGALDHEHSYTEVVTAPTCTTAGYTTKTCDCGDVQTVEGEVALGHIDENGDYKCDRTGCSSKVLPEDGSTLTIAEALKIGALQAANVMTTQKYYVTGTITEVYNTQYGNMYITDGTNTITVYGLYKDGKRYDAMSVKPVVGDEITVYGALTSYSSKAQFKNAELYEHNAHECDFSVEATCTKGASCKYCGAVQEGSEPIAHDFTYAPATCETPARCVCGAKDEGTELDHEIVDGECTREGCDYVEGVESEPEELVTFEFGANSSAAHVDGNDLGASKSYTENGYTLKLTGMSKVYGPAYDAKGNSCIKLGTSKVVGCFTFTVDDDVDQVIIRVAKYKSNTTKINVNGTAYTISGASNDGAYDEIVIDTTTTKTITFTTVSGGVRAMINSITYIG